MQLLKINHYPQTIKVGCLAACAQMVLRPLGISVSQQKLHRRFDPTPIGVPFSRLRYLRNYNVQVTINQGDLSDIILAIDQNTPPIIFLRTGELSYWQSDTQHAVVVVGYDNDDLLLNDPAFQNAPQRVLADELMLAWDELDNFYALLTR